MQKRTRLIRIASPLAVVALLGLAACGGDDDKKTDNGNASGGTGGGTETSTTVKVPKTYSFKSRADATKSGVTTSGQIFRHLLISDLKTYMGGLDDAVTNGDVASADVKKSLNGFYMFDMEAQGDNKPMFTPDPAAKQAKYNEVTAKNKDLNGKIAGNDAKGQLKDWKTEGIVGWLIDSKKPSPEALVQAWFDKVEAMAATRDKSPVGDTTADLPCTVSKEGQDYTQLVQKFLLGAVAYSQGTDDYLDDATEGKGLNSDNTEVESGKVNTHLESAWDEGFGYFGAARDYNDYSDDEIAGKPDATKNEKKYHDTDKDGKIDLITEVNWGNSVNAGKRDRGSKSTPKTDLTKDAFDAFVKGRAIIASAKGALSDDQMKALKAQRDIAVGAWEKAIAATCVHYINELLNEDLKDVATMDVDGFKAYAKHWSELKGFALGLQFNPRSKVSEAKFAELHQNLGTAPVSPKGSATEISDYKKNLEDARKILADAYEFDEANVTGW